MRFSILLLLLAVRPAMADDVLPSPAPSDDPDTQLARRFYDRATQAYDAHRYQEAAADFEKAREVKPAPLVDYHLGLCYDQLGKGDAALAAYRRYLDTNPPDHADEARARVAALSARATPPPVAQPRRGRPKWVWGLVGLSVFVAVGAVGLGLAFGVNSTQITPSLGTVHWR